MKKYFYNDGTNNLGPFTFEELKGKNISKETYVWFEGLADWKKAETIFELNELFSISPPPLKKENVKPAIPKANEKRVIDVFIFISLAYWAFMDMTNLLIEKLINNWYSMEIISFLQIAINIVFAIIPIVFAISIKNKALKTTAIIIAAFISVYILFENINWLFRRVY